jgi:hypothetical protein
LAGEDLGGHSGGRADEGSEVLGVSKFSEPEIGQLNFEILGNQNVCQFQVAVDHPVLPEHLEGVPKAGGDASGVLLWQAPAVVGLDMRVEVGELAVFEDEVEVAAALLVVDQVDDVGVLNHRQHFQLEVQPLKGLRTEVFEADLFDRIGLAIGSGFENGGVGPTADLLEQQIGANLAALLAIRWLFHSYN